ncbi:uncharacterized protein NPIL_441511 [Nephila pilipes]|uniref:Uncharacterized protein n=1 Tax=Nephila pilipes TaxID=299642 RepID=A0A8X6UIJ2_NEPPI|nr:uncharacterized protein NPIL_441511 [Nephila pilipes]
MNLTEDTHPWYAERASDYDKMIRVFAWRIYPLDIYSKESVDGELGGEESNSNNVTDNENNVTSADAVIVRKFTSSGRPVKAPTRLDLLNNVNAI